MVRPPFRLGIRAKLLLVLTVFLAIPWLGYATWHGYRAALDVSDWETLKEV